MEEGLFPKPEIVDLLKNMVRLRLYTDDRKHPQRSEQYIKTQQERFHSVAIPFFVVLSPEDQVLATFEGFTRDAEAFAAFIKSGLAKMKK